MIKIAPSFLSADFGNLESEIHKVEDAGAEYIHLDVMDAHFVPNLTFGPFIVEAIRKRTELVLDVHLMITDPGAYLQPFADSGADIFTIHAEIEDDFADLLPRIRSAGMKSGVSIKPATAADVLIPHLDQIDLALVMSVEPGFGGQSFMPEVLPKAASLQKAISEKGLETEIEIDGGIGPQNAAGVVRAGVRVIVAGSSAFRDGKVAENVAALRVAAEAGLERPPGN